MIKGVLMKLLAPHPTCNRTWQLQRMHAWALVWILACQLTAACSWAIYVTSLSLSFLIGRSDAEAEAPILWPPDVKSWLVGKDTDTGKDWGQEEKAVTEDEMVGWYHRLSGHEFEQAFGVGDEQGSLVCCSPWGRKDSDMTVQLNWAENTHNIKSIILPMFF